MKIDIGAWNNLENFESTIASGIEHGRKMISQLGLQSEAAIDFER